MFLTPKTGEGYEYVEFKYCACGCQKTLSKYYIQPSDGRMRKDREQRFIRGHYAKMEGNKFSTYNIKRPNELIDCQCGKCGEKFWKYNAHGTARKFKRGHNAKGEGNPMYHRNLSAQQRLERSLRNSGENNPNYGNLVENPEKRTLHKYVERYLPKTELCMLCKLIPPHHLANITGIYERDLKNWGWFCRSCHMKYDNIVRNLLYFTLLYSSDVECIKCLTIM